MTRGRRAFDQIGQGLRLLEETATIDAVLVIGCLGIDDGYAGLAGSRANPKRGLKRGLDIRVERTCRVEIGLNEIDQYQRRLCAKADLVIVGDLVIVFQTVGHAVFLCADHRAADGQDRRLPGDGDAMRNKF